MKTSRLEQLLVKPLQQLKKAYTISSIILLVAFTIYILNDKYHSNSSLAKQLPTLAAKALIHKDTEIFTQQIQQIVLDGQLSYITLLDSDKKVIVSIPEKYSSRMGEVFTPVNTPRIQQKEEAYLDENVLLDRTSLPPTTIGYLQYRFNYESFSIVFSIIFASCAALLVAIFKVGKKIGKNIKVEVVDIVEQISSSVDSINNGTYTHRIQVDDRSEITDLALKINILVGKLEHSDEQVFETRKEVMSSAVTIVDLNTQLTYELKQFELISLLSEKNKITITENKDAIINLLGKEYFFDTIFLLNKIMNIKNSNTQQVDQVLSPSLLKLTDSTRDLQRIFNSMLGCSPQLYFGLDQTVPSDINDLWIHIDQDKLQKLIYSTIRFVKYISAQDSISSHIRVISANETKLLFNIDLFFVKSILDNLQFSNIISFLDSGDETKIDEFTFKQELRAIQYYGQIFCAQSKLVFVDKQTSRFTLEFTFNYYKGNEQLVSLTYFPADENKLPVMNFIFGNISHVEKDEIKATSNNFEINIHSIQEVLEYRTYSLADAEIYFIDCDNINVSLAVLRAIQSKIKNGKYPVFCSIFTQKQNQATTKELFDAGFTFSLIRPITTEKLTKRISEILNTKTGNTFM